MSNERLEFLGDAVLGMVVTDHIFAAYPDMPEGELAKLRASVVSAAALAELAGELELGAAVRLGKGEAASGGGRKPSILADALEAVFGAVYLDGGMDVGAARSCAGCSTSASWRRPPVPAATTSRRSSRSWRPGTSRSCRRTRCATRDPTTRSASSPPCYLGGEAQGAGEGRSKKQAEQAAAHAAWAQLVRRFEEGGAVAATAH